MNLGCAPTSWAGVTPAIRRTYIRPLRDRLYPPDAQERLAAALHADEVISLDVGHNVARSAPAQLATLLGEIAARYPIADDPLSPHHAKGYVGELGG